MARGKRREVDPNSLAGRLRALRIAVGLSQPAAVEAVRRGPHDDVSQAHLSRIETEVSLPTPKQIRALLDAYGVTGEAAAQIIAEVDALAVEHVDARVVLQAGQAHNFQRRLTAVLDEAKVVRSYQHAIILGPLQTRAYADAVFAPDAGLSEADAAASLTERMTQTDKLDESGREWHLIQTEAAIRQPVRSYQLQAEQIEHLIGVSRKDNVRIGIVPLDAIVMEPRPMTGFHLYDNEQVVVGTDAGTGIWRGQKQVDEYRSLFEKVAARAVYGDEARAIMARIAEEYRSRT